MESSTVPTVTERASELGPRVYFHGSTRPKVNEFMAEYGLLASGIPTLAPTLELASDFTGMGARNYLTFWYPKKGEIQDRFPQSTKPRTPISDDERKRIALQIENSGLDDIVRQDYSRIVQEAQVILPPGRLGAIATLRYGDMENLASFLPSGDRRIISAYLSDKEGLTQRLRDLLDGMDFKFFNPSMDSNKLAGDIIKTGLEHYLLGIKTSMASFQHSTGRAKEVTGLDLEKDLNFLEGVVFQEPVYERFRGMLVSSLRRTISRLAA